MREFEPLERDKVRLAATVVLVRPAADSLEVYMVQRPAGGAFPDLHVFPGGKVDPVDWLPEYLDGISAEAADALIGVSGSLRYWIAAIRECFEESGVLLARRGGCLLTGEQTHSEHFAEMRQQLVEDRLTLETLCAEHDLRLAGDQVRYFSHWRTPAAAPRRFDTRFFVAAMPAGQKTAAHESELRSGHWVAPGAAIAAHRAGTWQMIAPTLITLETLADFHDIDGLLAAVAAERHLPPLTDELMDQGMCSLR
jgi:8-oxo-dGTP pyrophosphatase MutT (NUDIX family)